MTTWFKITTKLIILLFLFQIKKLNILVTRKQKTIDKLISSFGILKEEESHTDLVEKYFIKKDNTDSYQVLSNRLCNDLDINQLFTFIDRTTSKVGQQYLYNKLRVIPKIHVNNTINEKIIDQFASNPDFRISVQLQLEKLNNYNANYITSIFQDKHIEPPTWFFLLKLLSFASILSLVLILFNSTFILVSLGLFIINLVFHYLNKSNLQEYVISVPQLLKLHAIAKELFKHDILKQINLQLNTSINILDKVKNRISFFKFESKFTGEFESIFWSVFELFKILFLLEPILLFGALKLLDTNRKEIEDVYIFVGEIDSLISIASLRKGLKQYCIPVIVNNNKTIDANEVYHPLINNCIANSIIVDKKSILLTGSNMSGKTSFIRTIGINTITALTLNTCFANCFSLPQMKIFTVIRISDDLLNDKSYYFEEVLAIKEMISQSDTDEPILFLLDEIFKGTNTIERISAGKAVLSYLTKGNNIVFVSTHDIELTDLLKNEYELYHFSEKVDDKTVDFDFKLKEGKLTNRNAIKILDINGYPKSIITEAIAISKVLD